MPTLVGQYGFRQGAPFVSRLGCHFRGVAASNSLKQALRLWKQRDNDYCPAPALAGLPDDRMLAHGVPWQTDKITSPQASARAEFEPFHDLNACMSADLLEVTGLPNHLRTIVLVKLPDPCCSIVGQLAPIDGPGKQPGEHLNCHVSTSRLLSPAISPLKDITPYASVFESCQARRAELCFDAVQPGAPCGLGRCRELEPLWAAPVRSNRARYVSTLNKAQIVEIFQAYLDRYCGGGNAVEKICEFLDADGLDELVLNSGQSQRLMMIAAKFRKEVTATALWLLGHGIRAQCFRVTPYAHGDELFLDIQQIIPVPEAETFMIGMSAKESEEKSAQACRAGYRQLQPWKAQPARP